jgi:chromosome segregation ATPase
LAPADLRLPIADEALRLRAEELDRRAAELEAAGRQLAERFGMGEAKSGLEALEAYRAQLEHSEKLLATAQAQWQEKFRELAEQRAAFARFVETERKKLADDRRRWGESHQQDEREFQRQQSELANRQGALQALRGEVIRRQQETLEMRLATEELWTQLSAEAPPAAIAQSLGQIRLRLTEEFRLAKADLADERATIKQLAERVAGQHRLVSEKREQLQGWLGSRLRDFEQLSNQLAERERQVEERRQAIESERSQWQAERFRLEQELRKLLRHGGPRRNASAA